MEAYIGLNPDINDDNDDDDDNEDDDDGVFLCVNFFLIDKHRASSNASKHTKTNNQNWLQIVKLYDLLNYINS